MAKTHTEDLLPELALVFADKVRRKTSNRYETLVGGEWVKDSGALYSLVLKAARQQPPGPVRSVLYGHQAPYLLLRLLAASGYQDEEGVFRATSTW